MQITVRYWGQAARLAGCEIDTLVVADGACVADAVAALDARAGSSTELRSELRRCAFALDDRLVRRDAPLHPAVTLDILPPVSGG